VGLVARTPEKLDALVTEITEAGGRAIAAAGDATDAASFAAAVDAVSAAYGAPTVVVFNVGGVDTIGGSFPPPGFLDTDVEKLRKSMDITFFGAVNVAKTVLPAMVEAGGGTLIFTGATASLRGSAKFMMLSAPKFALRSLTQSLAREFGPAGVHVAHVIVDGMVKSAMTEKWGKKPDEVLDPDDIAETYLTLAQQKRSAWTQEIDVRPFTEKW